MKRITACLALLGLLSGLLVGTACAADVTYDLEELELRLALPDELLVYTREIPDDDPNLATYGLTKDTLLERMQASNVYLDAWDVGATFEITVTMMRSEMPSFYQLPDSLLLTLSSTLEADFEAMDIELLGVELFAHSQTKFLKIDCAHSRYGDPIRALQFYTVYDGMAINVTLLSFSGRIDADQAALLCGIVDSLRFDNEPPPGKEPLQTDGFVYTDPFSGAALTLPANWILADRREGDDYLITAFTSTLDEGVQIFFACTDFWSALPEAEQLRLPRSQTDNSALDSAYLTALCDCTEADLTTTVFSGLEYFCVERVDMLTSFGWVFEVPTTSLVRCENGYVYLFELSGVRDGDLYRDFEALVESVVYPAAADADAGVGGAGTDVRDEPETNAAAEEHDAAAEEDPAASSAGAEEDDSPVSAAAEENPEGKAAQRHEWQLWPLLLTLLITAGAMLLPLVLFRFGILKRPLGAKRAKWVALVYGGLAFVLVLLLVLFARVNAAACAVVLLCGWVGYRLLAGPAAQSAPSADAGKSDKQILFCHRCGNRLVPGSRRCDRCGTEIPDVERER